MLHLGRKNIFILLILIFLSYTVNSYGDATIKRYYNEELKRIRFHLGFSGGIGYDWFFNYEDNNNFVSYPIMIKIFQDIDPGSFGLAFGINQNMEAVDFTDKLTYYGSRFYNIWNGMIGIRTKFYSFIPFTKYISPYFMVGFGVLSGNYKSIILINNRVMDSTINSFGYSIASILGTEIYILPSFIAIDLGVKFYYNFGVDVYTTVYNDSDSTNINLYNGELLKEQILNLYIGVSYYLF